MELGNASYNKLYDREEKHYENAAENIDLNNRNNSLTLVVDAVEPGTTVLDVGCSFGYIGEWLIKNRNCSVYGIDIDETALKEVKEKGFYEDAYNINLDEVKDYHISDKEIPHEELNRLISSKVKFDYIICADVIEHFQYPTEALNLLGALLKHEGKIVVSIPNISNMDIILNLIEERFNYSDKGILDNTHAKFYTEKSFFEWIYTSNSFFKGFKLDVEKIGCTTHRTELAENLKNRFPYLYDFIYTANPSLETFQNIFLLKRIDKDDSAAGLNSRLESYKKMLISEFNGKNTGKVSKKVSSEAPLEFKLISPSRHLKSISFLFGTHNKVTKGKIDITLYNQKEKQVVAKKTISSINVNDNEFYEVDLGSLYLSQENLYFKIETDLNEQEGFSLYLNEEGIPYTKITYYGEEFHIRKAAEDFSILNSMEMQLREKYNLGKYYREKHKAFRNIEEDYKKKLKSGENMISAEEYNSLKKENLELRKMLQVFIMDLIK
ncbi:class I SAM-dependent methyltransferase [Clostridium polynesiense]|uniref:class I SAM-dependent methyltransferase n=1 Tax=Clostridium polynesiense TaxID=1325933 RepID=UPI000590DD5B|nr:methyltransferase domain-containing protein [Clostridium polynesiense]